MKEAVVEELSVLEAIYPDQLKQLSSDILEIVLPEHNLKISFTISPDYPQTLPGIVLCAQHSPSSSSAQTNTLALTKYLLEQAEGMRGQPMMFSIVSLIGDHISEYKCSKTEIEPIEAVATSNIKQYKTIEVRSFVQGTPVTRETFTQWHSEFIREHDPLALANESAVSTGAHKLTGKQLFEQRGTSHGDDLLGDNEEDFEIDEGLFVDLDDLDSESSVE